MKKATPLFLLAATILLYSCGTMSYKKTYKMFGSAKEKDSKIMVAYGNGDTIKGAKLKNRYSPEHKKRVWVIDGKEYPAENVDCYQDKHSFVLVVDGHEFMRFINGHIDAYYLQGNSGRLETTMYSNGRTTARTVGATPGQYYLEKSPGWMVVLTYSALEEKVKDYAPAYDLLKKTFPNQKENLAWNYKGAIKVIKLYNQKPA